MLEYIRKFSGSASEKQCDAGTGYDSKAFYDRCSPHAFCGTGTDRRTAVPATSYESGSWEPLSTVISYDDGTQDWDLPDA